MQILALNRACRVLRRMRAEDVEDGVDAIRVLAELIGPRPPASSEEAAAALFVSSRLSLLGASPVTSEFRSQRSFGPSYLVIYGLALIAGVLRRGPLSYLVGAVAAAVGVEGSRFGRFGVEKLIGWRRSRNVWGCIEPRSSVARTICIVSHLDSSRSGLMFHPRVTPVLGKVVGAMGIALILQALDPLIGRRGLGRLIVWRARAMCALAFGLVLEREIAGTDVAGANDNASGVGACLALASRFSREPLENSRIVVLFTGSEESGVHGMTEFLRSQDTDGWMFVNFDGVSADARLRVLSKEGGPLSNLKADPELLELAAKVGAKHSELEAEPLEHGSGLPYDSTPVLMSGGRAMSVVNQDGAIPDYHWPSDRFDKVSVPAFERAVTFGEQLLLEIDVS